MILSELLSIHQGDSIMKKGLVAVLLLSIFTSLILAQDEPAYLQVNSGTDILINSGQSAYIVLQMNNPSTETLNNVTVFCEIDTISGSVSIATEDTQAYILDSTTFTETSVTFGDEAEVDFPAGQSGNVQLVIDVEANETETAKARITCEMLADGESLGSVEVELASTEGSSTASSSESSSEETEAEGATIRINNGAEIRVAEDESIELVIQVGNSGDQTLRDVVLTCTLGAGLNVVEERTNPRDFISYSYDNGTVVFGENEEISLPSGQNTTVALGVVLNSSTDISSAGVSCSINSDNEESSNLGNTVVSDRNAENDSEDVSASADNDGTLSINNGSEMTLGEGQSAELVLQFGNSSQEALDNVSIVCSISVDAGAISFNDERTTMYMDGEYVFEGDTLTMSLDDEIPQGQNLNVAIGIQVDEVDTEGTVSCELLNDDTSLASDSIAISGN